MTPCVLFRPGVSDEDEELAVRRHFPVYTYRAEVPAGSLVVGRYACLPFYNELEKDVELLGSRLVNTYREHCYVAQLDYYEDLRDVTFPTWFRFEEVPQSERANAFVVKGRTNSRKSEWFTKMYAPNFQAAVNMGADLATDGLIGTQGVVLRKYVPLETFETSVKGTPVTNEWRLFYFRGQRLAHGYYWGNISDWAPVHAATAEFERTGLAFADAVAVRLVDKIPFVVIDIARDTAGKWWVVELNDGCQSGLNGVIDPDVLYGALRKSLQA